MEEAHTQVVHQFDKGDGERIHCSLRLYKGNYYVDLRVWFRDKKTSEFFPTRRGLCFSLQYLDEMYHGIRALQHEATRFRHDPDAREAAAQKTR